MVNKVRFILVFVGMFCFSACGILDTEFKHPAGLLFTSVKAPLTLDAPGKVLGEPKRETYVSKFLWIPMITTIAVTPNDQNDPVDNYTDYEYESYLFGLFQTVSVITYK